MSDTKAYIVNLGSGVVHSRHYAKSICQIGSILQVQAARGCELEVKSVIGGEGMFDGRIVRPCTHCLGELPWA